MNISYQIGISTSLGVTYLTGISRSSLCKLTKVEHISTVFISREEKAAIEILSLSARFYIRNDKENDSIW